MLLCILMVDLNFVLLFQTEFGTAIFEDVADVCYNMLDHLQQYKQYLDSMKLIRVPVHSNASASAASINQPSSEQLPGSQSTTAAQGEYCFIVWFHKISVPPMEGFFFFFFLSPPPPPPWKFQFSFFKNFGF